MTHKLSLRVQQVIRYSREEAFRLGHDVIGTEHLLLGVLRLGEGIAVRVISNLGCDTDNLRETLEDTIGSGSTTLKIGDIPFTKRAERVLRSSYSEGKQYNSEVIGTEHLLLALTKDEDGLTGQVLTGFSINYESVKAAIRPL